MRSTRAKALRRELAMLHRHSPEPAISFRRLKKARPPSFVKPLSPPRRSMPDKRVAAIARGAAERAERKRLIEGDDWLAAQPWMTIERLRRVAGMRKALSRERS